MKTPCQPACQFNHLLSCVVPGPISRPFELIHRSPAVDEPDDDEDAAAAAYDDTTPADGYISRCQ